MAGWVGLSARAALITVAAILAIVSLGTAVALYDWSRRQAEAVGLPYDNLQWAAYQGGLEAIRLYLAFVAGDANRPDDDIGLRHEIYQSRLVTIASGSTGALLRRDPDAGQLLIELERLGARFDDALGSGAALRPETWSSLALDLRRALDLHAALGVRAMQVSAWLRTQALLRLEDRKASVTRLGSVAVGCAIGLFIIVTLQMRHLAVARRRAEAASVAKSAFLATMSHELRTPLSGVIGTLDLLADDPLPPAARERVAIARRSAELLLEIIGDVLDAAKLESGRMAIETLPLRLDRLVEDTLAGFAATAQAKGIALCAEIAAPAAGWFGGDPTRLRQILANLMSNALKFTEAGSVTVRVTAQLGQGDGPATVTIAVADTGIGIPAEILPRLGTPFQQADSSTTRRFGGTGLGLAICRSLAEAMGGTLDIRSRLGQGTTVTVTLALPRAEAAEAQASPPAPGAGEGVAALLVDDNEVGRLTVCTMLRRLGASVEVATDGAEAVAKAAARRYDLILMDLQMPTMDGLEATRRIRAGGGASAGSMIVALTANAFAEDTARCLAAGMDAHLAKPLRRAALAALLGRLRARRAVAVAA